MSEVLYPMGYGTRLVTFDVLRNTFEPFMHPEAARRGFNFILHQGGKFGIGGGYRPPGAQPDRPGFAPEVRVSQSGCTPLKGLLGFTPQTMTHKDTSRQVMQLALVRP